MKNRPLILLCLIVIVLILPAGASVSYAQNFTDDMPAIQAQLTLNDPDTETAPARDPFRRYNEWMFRVNDKIYRRIFHPVSREYDRLVPKKARESLSNFSRFIRTPIRFVNNLLQRKYKNAAKEFERLVINATFGVAGLFDIADKHFKLPAPPSENLTQTLGSWGIGSGPYIVLPILGPSDLRNIFGMIGDTALHPVTWAKANDWEPEEIYNAWPVVDGVNNYSTSVRETYDGIMKDAINEYIAVRQIYAESTKKKIEE